MIALGLAGAGLLAFIVVIGVVLGKRNPPPYPPPLGDNDLDYCPGCGCRHKRQWMRWTADGRYRCVVCCREKVS